MKQQSLNTKITNKLFANKFRYKIVLVTKFASMFRNKDLSHVYDKLCYYKERQIFPPWIYNGNPADYTVAKDICEELQNVEVKHSIMVSSPFISFYVDDEEVFNKLCKNLYSKIKYVSIPSGKNTILEKNTVYLKRVPYEYKVTITNKINNNESFLKWCENNDKIRMPKRCYKHINRGYKVGDSYFYVKDDKCLSIVKIFLGSNIQRVDKVVNQSSK